MLCCSSTTFSGYCNIVASEDADALTFGSKIMVRNLFSTDQKKRLFHILKEICQINVLLSKDVGDPHAVGQAWSKKHAGR